jgi:hypothetical protein
MKTYTIQFTLEEGSDEFWESNPTPEKVWDVVEFEMRHTNLDFDNVKIIKIVDETEYDEGEQQNGKLPEDID